MSDSSPISTIATGAEKPNRETLASSIGFLLVSAGCAIGLGNVWRFPYITGKYGGALFVLIYLLALVLVAAPLLIVELALGRASRRSIQGSYTVLAPHAKKYRKLAGVHIAGNWLLMMYYTTVSGWMFAYALAMIRGSILKAPADTIEHHFTLFLESPVLQIGWMTVALVVGFAICSLGLRKGVESCTKYMMAALFLILIGLCVYCVQLPGAREGLAFYLKPNFDVLRTTPLSEIVFAAVGQAFFTLSIGIGSMAIFGSYASDKRRLTGESFKIMGIDTTVAILSGLVIFPACAAYSVATTQGPKLIFITLPQVFHAMPAGHFWGALFFIFLLLAALTTLIAVFENLIAMTMEARSWTRRKAIAIIMPCLWILSLPCALGYNVLSWITPMGKGSTILDIEDFLLSNWILPLGALAILVFCVNSKLWGWDKLVAEIDKGEGMKFPKWSRLYVMYVLPVILLLVFIFALIFR